MLNTDDGGKIIGRIDGRVGNKGIKNLSNVKKLVKSKKLDFTNVKLSRIDFFYFQSQRGLYLSIKDFY